MADATAIFDASDGLLTTALSVATSRLLSAEYAMQKLRDAHTTASGTWLAEFVAFDGDLGAFVASLANAAYPKPSGDEALLRQEAATILHAGDADHRPVDALRKLAGAERRDLAAFALSPWASTWAGTRGVSAPDLQAVRLAAIEAAKDLGAEAEQAAARAYADAMALLGVRPCMVIAAQAAGNVAPLAAGLGFNVDYPVGKQSIDLLAWRAGPADAPPSRRSEVAACRNP